MVATQHQELGTEQKLMDKLPTIVLGKSGIEVTRVALGLWPIAGMTTLGANETDSLATIHEARKQGVTFFDTAYCYGVDGTSERLLGQAARGRREEFVIATKGGVHWADDLSRVNDASPRRLRFECEESLSRLEVDHVDLLYLHSPDRVTPIEESASVYLELLAEGKTRAVGLSNATFDEMQRFHSVCPLDAIQPRYNMLQRDIEADILPWCQQQGVAVVGYWPLMKGLLAGKIRRDYHFDPADKRLTYPVFQSPQWEWNQELLDHLDVIARGEGVTVAQLVVAWTLEQPGIGVALCGAKRPWQIAETVAAGHLKLSESCLSKIKIALERRRERELVEQA